VEKLWNPINRASDAGAVASQCGNLFAVTYVAGAFLELEREECSTWNIPASAHSFRTEMF